MVPDPVDSTVLVNVLHAHGRFTTTDIKQAYTLVRKHWDTYLIHNDEDAKACLLATVDAATHKRLSVGVPADDTFGSTWVRLMKYCNDGTVQKRKQDLDKLQRMSPRDSPGCNVDLCAQEAMLLFQNLESSPEYLGTPILGVHKQLSSISEVPHFSIKYLNSYNTLSNLVEQIDSQPIADKHAHLKQKNFWYTDVLDSATTEYNRFRNNIDPVTGQSEWGPANLPTDSSGAPRALLAGAGGDPSNGSSGGGDDNNGNQSRSRSWRYTKQGPTLERNGRTFYWCSTCNNNRGVCTPTHGDSHPTKPHRSREELAAARTAADAAAAAAAAPPVVPATAPSPAPAPAAPAPAANVASSGHGVSLDFFFAH